MLNRIDFKPLAIMLALTSLHGGATAHYTQSDPIGLAGGSVSTYTYVNGNPLSYIDPRGLFGYAEHRWITKQALGGDLSSYPDLDADVAGVDFQEHSQDTDRAFWHHMRDGKTGQSVDEARLLYEQWVDGNIKNCNRQGLARALHAAQDSFAAGHRDFQPWSGGIPSAKHLRGDVLPSTATYVRAIEASKTLIERYKAECECSK
ncbi:RHS repeat-associated core domain-containing protein [Rhizobacter sp. P5_C2]